MGVVPKHLESIAIVSVQAILRAEPDESLVVPEHAVNSGLGQPVLHRKPSKADVFLTRRHNGRDKNHRNDVNQECRAVRELWFHESSHATRGRRKAPLNG